MWTAYPFTAINNSASLASHFPSTQHLTPLSHLHHHLSLTTRASSSRAICCWVCCLGLSPPSSLCAVCEPRFASSAPVYNKHKCLLCPLPLGVVHHAIVKSHFVSRQPLILQQVNLSIVKPVFCMYRANNKKQCLAYISSGNPFFNCREIMPSDTCNSSTKHKCGESRARHITVHLKRLVPFTILIQYFSLVSVPHAHLYFQELDVVTGMMMLVAERHNKPQLLRS